MDKIVPIAMPGTHERFFAHFSRQSFPIGLKILDVGAGHGAFAKRLFDMGYDVAACDLFPDTFHFDKIPCKKVDITREFPYPDDQFDIVIAIEVSEHIIDHEVFFEEIFRILKPGGHLFITTPNILSLKSRMHFLLRGFSYSFGPLEMNNYDGLQHVASLTLDQYNYVAIKHGFQAAEVGIDREQRTSHWLRILLGPWMWLNTWIKGAPKSHNQRKLLLGRILFLDFKKAKISPDT